MTQPITRACTIIKPHLLARTLRMRWRRRFINTAAGGTFSGNIHDREVSENCSNAVKSATESCRYNYSKRMSGFSDMSSSGVELLEQSQADADAQLYSALHIETEFWDFLHFGPLLGYTICCAHEKHQNDQQSFLIKVIKLILNHVIVM